LKNRSSNDIEKFPAQVSLPGGKPEKGENLLQTAIRETQEETGLNLLDEFEFAYLGEFPSTLPFMRMRKMGSIFVKAFLFLQISFDPISIHPNPGEIDECLWTSIEYFVENPKQFFERDNLNFLANTPQEFI